ncbi:hypothetical protein IOD16_07070 [Saccharothrix sp. 6-C]|uniref:hypothetical protein n=1 Tax=Saccharothrix sp. 6-C TaxID=2781735 RepID=UPI0019174D8C|nr:hypothetical protein [Saccharothrix sp. 6-C]QQQ78227.1 hypothetical protein IOD16_07070 [Saccharothrix sp. 6-C]
MSIQLAFGVTAGPGSRCWLPVSGGRAVPAGDRAGAHPPGAPVAVGPADAGPDVVREAIRRLVLLVVDGTETAAAAGVDLGGGFTSARLAGARGDRRDAVLAALEVLGDDGAHRLGDRTAGLVALFGPSATKRVGSAAHAAVAEQRWAALRLASAASDLLGPEQVERVLELRAPDGVDPFPRGAASTLADHLSRALSGYPRPRRLALVLSLWEHVCASQVERRRARLRAASQTRLDRIGKLRERHRDHFEEPVLQQLVRAVGGRPTLVAAARWQPPLSWTAQELARLLHDAVAATALLRFAKTLSDEGLAVAVEKHRDELVAADACLTEDERSGAARRVPGGYSHPARPGCYVHQLVEALGPDRTVTAKTETYVKTRVAMARNYGVVVFDAVAGLLTELDDRPLHNCWDTCAPWQVAQLRRWRDAAGFARAPESWEQPPLADGHADGPAGTLAQRLATGGPADAASVEAPHDLLWFADLADALAPFHGNTSAAVRHEPPVPELVYDAPAPQPEPGRPRADSVPLAAAGVAQLIMFGATPPPRCGSWAELAAGVGADAVIVEAGIGAFPVPSEVSVVDTRVVPGTDLVVEVGREPRKLAEWSAYMGNCIGESWYADQARKGQCVLMALRDPVEGRIVANLDIRRRTGGWHVHELRARFNDAVDPALREHVKQWVDGLPMPGAPAPEPVLPVPPVRARGGSGRRPAAGRLPAALTDAVVPAVERELTSAAAESARRAYATLARGLGQGADFDPDAAVVALKRLGPGGHVALLRAGLDAGLDASVLWRATRVRPLAAAVGRLDPGLREHDRLRALTEGSPLPRTLRTLVRRPEIAPAHAMDVVARAVRAAMGGLVGDDALARSVARRPSTELVCALAIATTCAAPSTTDTVRVVAPGQTSVPGFPASDLADENGPWQRARAAAVDLGAPAELVEDRVAEHGLLVPAALLGTGGWPALWRRAHR